MLRLGSLGTAATEATPVEPVTLQQEKPLKSLHLATREEPMCSSEDLAQPKKYINKLIKKKNPNTKQTNEKGF